MNQGTTDVVTGNPDITGTGGYLSDPVVPDVAGTLYNANVLSISLWDLDLFAGIGASLNTNGTANPDDDAIDLGSAIGFSIDTGTVDLGLVKSAESVAGAQDSISYLGMAISLSSASLTGIDGLTIKLTGTVLLNRATASDGTELDDRIDWDSVSNPLLPDFSGGPDMDDTIVVSGSVTVDLFGFVIGTAQFSMSRTTVDVDANGNDTFSTALDKDLEDATMLKIGLNIDQAWVGVGASLDEGTGELDTEGAIGFLVEEGQLGFVSIRANEQKIAGDTRSYSAISSSLGLATFVGIPGIDIIATDIQVELNSATGVVPGTTTAANAINWNTMRRDRSFGGSGDNRGCPDRAGNRLYRYFRKTPPGHRRRRADLCRIRDGHPACRCRHFR
jgi:hypothetical protein